MRFLGLAEYFIKGRVGDVVALRRRHLEMLLFVFGFVFDGDDVASFEFVQVFKHG